MKVYIGFDGSYVVSRYPLKLCTLPDGDGGATISYLAPAGHRAVCEVTDGEAAFGHLGLKLHEVAWAEITVRRVLRPARRSKK